MAEDVAHDEGVQPRLPGERTDRVPKIMQAGVFQATSLAYCGRAARSETVGATPHSAAEAVDPLQADAPGLRVRAATVLLDGAVKVELDDLDLFEVSIEGEGRPCCRRFALG